MNDHESFLSAIRDATDKREARLIYADWLEEQGDPRGELLRACVKEIDDGEPSDWRERFAALCERDQIPKLASWFQRAYMTAHAQLAVENLGAVVKAWRDERWRGE